MVAMQPTLKLRRLPKYGWSVESDDDEILAIKRDDGSVTSMVGRLMGTREAARFLGVQPSNFVRDWASRADFPAPVAGLSSGRVWSASDVKSYAAARRAPPPDDGRIDEIARRLVWWQPPEQTRTRPLDLVARVLATGTIDEIRDVERRFGRPSLRAAVTSASPGVFDRRSWHYWLLALDLDRSWPLPVRNVPLPSRRVP